MHNSVTDPFAIFGLPRHFDLDRNELERRYRQLQRALHPDRHTHASASERRMRLSKAIEVNEAYRVLSDELQCAQALLRLLRPGAGSSGAESPGGMPPEFLVQMMELREELAEARAVADRERVARLNSQMRELRETELQGLRDGFARVGHDSGAGGQVLGELERRLQRLRYYQRFVDEVAAIEEVLDEQTAKAGAN